MCTDSKIPYLIAFGSMFSLIFFSDRALATRDDVQSPNEDICMEDRICFHHIYHITEKASFNCRKYKRERDLNKVYERITECLTIKYDYPTYNSFTQSRIYRLARERCGIIHFGRRSDCGESFYLAKSGSERYRNHITLNTYENVAFFGAFPSCTYVSSSRSSPQECTYSTYELLNEIRPVTPAMGDERYLQSIVSKFCLQDNICFREYNSITGEVSSTCKDYMREHDLNKVHTKINECKGLGNNYEFSELFSDRVEQESCGLIYFNDDRTDCGESYFVATTSNHEAVDDSDEILIAVNDSSILIENFPLCKYSTDLKLTCSDITQLDLNRILPAPTPEMPSEVGTDAEGEPEPEISSEVETNAEGEPEPHFPNEIAVVPGYFEGPFQSLTWTLNWLQPKEKYVNLHASMCQSQRSTKCIKLYKDLDDGQREEAFYGYSGESDGNAAIFHLYCHTCPSRNSWLIGYNIECNSVPDAKKPFEVLTCKHQQIN